MEEGKMEGKGMVCKCPHHMAIPWLIILIGVDFLLGAISVLTWNFVDITWPILLIIAGIIKLAHCKCCSK